MRFKFSDDLSILEKLNLILSGLSSYNVRNHVASDIGINQKYLPSNHIPSQENLKEIEAWTDRNIMKLNVEKSKVMVMVRPFFVWSCSFLPNSAVAQVQLGWAKPLYQNWVSQAHILRDQHYSAWSAQPTLQCMICATYTTVHDLRNHRVIIKIARYKEESWNAILFQGN